MFRRLIYWCLRVLQFFEDMAAKDLCLDKLSRSMVSVATGREHGTRPVRDQVMEQLICRLVGLAFYLSFFFVLQLYSNVIED